MKDLKRLCRTLCCAEQGGSLVVILLVVAVAAAGVLGFFAGKNSGSDIVDVIPSSSKEGMFTSAEVVSPGQPNPVVARIDGTEIKRQDVLDLMNAMPMQMRQVPVNQLYPMALEQVIANKLADLKASMEPLERDMEVQKQINDAKQQIIRAHFIGKSVAERVSNDDIKAEYAKYVENFPEVEEIKAAHILVESEKEAKDIIKKLDDGEDFAELAKANSKDGSAERGGKLGYFAKNEVVSEFAEAAFSTEVGSYTKEPVKSEFGYHIVRVDEKRMRPAAPLERVQSYIKQEIERKELQAMLDEWKNAANIERFDINGNPLKMADSEAELSNDDREEVESEESGEAAIAAEAEPEAGSIEASEPAAGDEAAIVQ